MFFTGRMPFLPPNQQRLSTEGTSKLALVQLGLLHTLAACHPVLSLLDNKLCTIFRENIIIIIIIIKDIYTVQVRKGHKCATSAETAVMLRNCLCRYIYLHN